MSIACTLFSSTLADPPPPDYDCQECGLSIAPILNCICPLPEVSSSDDDDTPDYAPAARLINKDYGPCLEHNAKSVCTCSTSKAKKQCTLQAQIRTITSGSVSTVLAAVKRLKVGTSNVLIVDTGAGELCFNTLAMFVPGSLVTPCGGEKIVDAGGHTSPVTKIGRVRFRCNKSDHVIDSKNLWAWYVPGLAFNLVSVGKLKGLGYGMTIGLENIDALVHKASAKRIPLMQVQDVFVMEIEPVTPKTGLANYIMDGFSATSDLAGSLQADLLWNMNMRKEKLMQDNAQDAAVTKRDGLNSDGVTRKPTQKCREAIIGLLTCIALPLTLLHQRMGHTDARGLARAVDSGNVQGVTLKGPKTLRHHCNDCRLAKTRRSSFNVAHTPDDAEDAKKLMDINDDRCVKPGRLIHMDGVGPIETQAIDGFTGFYTYVDEATRAIWCKLYKTPRDAYRLVKELNHDLKTKFGSKGIQVIKTDQLPMWDSTSMPWRSLERQEGFRTTYSAVYTPEQNSTAERANGSVLSCARTLLIASSLGKRYWGHAVLYACEILMCTTRLRLGGKTPYELLHGRAPNIERFRIFGCRAWAVVPKANRKKMDPKAVQGIFVGFSSKASAYLVHVPGTGKIIESAHCLFDESKFGGDPALPITTFSEVQALWRQPDQGLPMQAFTDCSPVPAAAKAVSNPTKATATEARKLSRAQDKELEEFVNDVVDTGENVDHLKENYFSPADGQAEDEVVDRNDQSWRSESDELSDELADEMGDGASNDDCNQQSHRSSRSRKAPDRMNCSKLGNSAIPRRVDHVSVTNTASGAKASHFAQIVCYIAAAVNILCDVGPIDDCGPWSPGWAIKRVTYDSPASFKSAMARDDSKLWMEAWNTECSNMKKLGVLEQVNWPTDGSNVCGSTLVCKIKRLANGALDKYRVRWVAQGFSQRWGMDYFDTASPVVNTASVRIIVAIANFTGAVAKQLDIPTAFLRAKLNERVFMRPPTGVELPDIKGKKQCYLCKQGIYGLKQASHGWYHTCTKAMFLTKGWSRCLLDNCVFIKRSGKSFIIAALFVDDCLYISNCPKLLKEFEHDVQLLYQVKKFEELNWYLGMKFTRNMKKGTIEISMRQFVEDALKRYQLEGVPSKKIPVPTDFVFEEVDPECALGKKDQKLYMEKVGSLNYLAGALRGDIAWVTSKLGMFMQQADSSHMKIADQVFLYLAGTMDYCMRFDRSAGLTPVAYSDASFADNGKTGANGRRRSQSGCCVLLGGCAVVYHSRGQKNVALSTAESEYVALSGCVQEVIWVRRLLTFLGFQCTNATVVYEDNEAAQALATNDSMTKKSRFVDVRFHYTREMVSEGEIEVRRCPTADMTADLYTKALCSLILIRHSDNARGATASRAAMCVVKIRI